MDESYEEGADQVRSLLRIIDVNWLPFNRFPFMESET